MRTGIKGLVALALLALFTSCAEMTVAADKNLIYRRDMKIYFGELSGKGTLVVPKQSAYHFDIKAKGAADLFTVESCHREMVWENAGESGFFADQKRVQFDYNPIQGLETGSSCVMRIGAYNKAGRHSWAMVDFEGEDATLPADVKCNGSAYASRGVTICQSKMGLVQEIAFPVEVAYSPDPECPLPPSKDGKIFRWNMVRGECVYAFMEKTTPNRVHRLTTIGYDQVLIRGD